MSERSTSSSDVPSVVSGRLPKYSMPTNLPAFMRLIASSTAWRSGCRSSHVELTKIRATVGSILRLLAWRARADSARLNSPKVERLGTAFQQTLMATSVAAENLRLRAALVNGFIRQVRYNDSCRCVL